MPRVSGKRKPAGGKLGAVVAVLVVAAIAIAGGWYWSRASAANVALEYLRVASAVVTEGKIDIPALKGLLCKRDAAELAEKEAEIQQMSGLLSAMAAQVGGQVQVDFEAGKVSAGLSKATVDVQVDTSFGAQSNTSTNTIYLVREGLSWKVDAQKSQQQGGTGAGLPFPGPGAGPGG